MNPTRICNFFQSLVKESEMLYPVKLLRGLKPLPKSPEPSQSLSQFTPITARIAVMAMLLVPKVSLRQATLIASQNRKQKSETRTRKIILEII